MPLSNWAARFRTALATAFFISAPLSASQVRLSWDPSETPEVVAYILYVGTSADSLVPRMIIPAGVTSTGVPELVEGAAYTFAVSAVDDMDLESEFSNILSYTVPFTTPSAVSKTITTLEDQSMQILLAGSDPNSDPITFRTTTFPANGTLAGIPPALTYRPNPNFFGQDSFTYTASDASSTSTPATVTINVTPVNDAPTLNGIASLTIVTNSGPRTITLSGISSGAPNESQPLTVTATSSNPALLSPTISYSSPSASGSLTFKPALNQIGAATITVTVNDGQSINNVITRSFTVSVLPPAPTISNAAEVANDARTLQIRWDTDQLATCFLEYGTNLTFGNLIFTSGTTHTATLSNLQPATTYYLRVRAVNSAGSSSLTDLGTANTERINVITVLAGTAVLTAPMVSSPDLTALAGAYLSSPTTGSGKGMFNVTVPYGLNYRAWARARAPLAGGSFSISVDAGTQTLQNIPATTLTPVFRWMLLTNATGPLIVPLAGGAHQITVHAGIAYTQVDEVVLSNDPLWQPSL